MSPLYLSLMRTALLCFFVYSVSACAQKSDLSSQPLQLEKGAGEQSYTVLDPLSYQTVVADARTKLQGWIDVLQKNKHQDANQKVRWISEQLLDVPYLFTGAMGEGDWQPRSFVYQPGALHIKQDPVYRLDGLDCQTFVQVVMALLYAHDLDDFDQRIVNIAYGAAGNPQGEMVRYYNRNHFVDGDWNPINQRHGYLVDVTEKGGLAPYSKQIPVYITRNNWFLFQHNEPSVRVLHSLDGPQMVERFRKVYTSLDFPRFAFEKVVMSYLPKEKLASRRKGEGFRPNRDLLKKIPTPAVVEIVRDPSKWIIGGKPIQDVIGSQLSVSHMGLLYRHAFKKGELIYHQTSCDNSGPQKTCQVSPVVCDRVVCDELMFVHATDGFPRGYYWYQQPNGNYTCSADLPSDVAQYTTCNRVTQKPLFDYLTEYQYGKYTHMDNPSILGIHIEQIVE